VPALSAGDVLGLLVPHAYVLRWWLAAEALGFAALPLLFRLCAALPSRGYAYAKVAALALLTLALWLLGTAGLLPYGAGSALLVVALIAAAAAVIALQDRAELWTWLRENRRFVITAEIVFLLALLVITGFRAFTPEIANTEKPFEFAMYNAVDRARFFAPTDPWFSGKPTAYYYLGYVAVDAVAKLTGTPPAYGFNVGLGLIGALTAVTAFGLACDCGALLRRAAVASRWVLGVGLLAVVLLLVIGNLEGIFELAAVHGWNPSWVYSHLDVQGLQPAVSAHWWPENFFSSAWRATRLGSQWNFLEFPFFSFMLGDLHPHVLALPFKLLAAVAALLLLFAPALPRCSRDGWRRGLGTALFAAATLGLLIGVHPWDFPPFLLLALLVLAARYVRDPGTDRRDLGGYAAIGVVAALPAVLYYFGGGRGSTTSIQPTEPYFTSLQGTVNAEGMYLPFQHLVIFWTPLLLPAAIFVVACLASRGWRPWRQHGPLALTLVALLPLAWAIAVILRHSGSGLRSELDVRGWGWLTVLLLGLLLAAALAAFAGELTDDEGADGIERQGRIFLLGATVVAVLLIYGPELFMVRDSSGTRANSTFKLWYAAWTLLAIVAAAGGVYALAGLRRFSLAGLVARRAALAACAVVLLGALVYPAYVIFNRTDGFSGTTTLDGLAYLRTSDPQEYAAAQWLRQNVAGDQTVLQADGNSYTAGGRFASLTGLPTLMGWMFHEQQQRGDAAGIAQRDGDISTIYSTQSIDTAFTLLHLYDVQYVVVGPLEQQMYGASGGLSKFADLGTLVYSGGSGTAIYRVGAAANGLIAAVRP
jgi:YYY domain-containing protein